MRRSDSQVPVAAGLAAALGALLYAERTRPLRKRVDPGWRRVATNVAMAGVTAVVIGAVEAPLVRKVAQHVEAKRWGIVPRLGLPRRAAAVVAMLLLDYTLYLWHALLHRSPLWRVHRVHHADLDLDVSTALRFHFAEFLLSVPWRTGQVALIGVSPSLWRAWSTLTFAGVLFHHANVRLPLGVERRLSRIVVTPCLHGIHHSVIPDESGANLSSGLTVWDLLHGTFRDDVPQGRITIGLAGYSTPADVSLAWSLTAPFVDAAADERSLSGSGTRPRPTSSQRRSGR